MMKRTFIEVLNEYLDTEHIKKSDFAKKIDVKPSQVSEWLRGKANPGYETLQKISLAFDITADYWLGLIDTY